VRHAHDSFLDAAGVSEARADRYMSYLNGTAAEVVAFPTGAHAGARPLLLGSTMRLTAGSNGTSLNCVHTFDSCRGHSFFGRGALSTAYASTIGCVTERPAVSVAEMRSDAEPAAGLRSRTVHPFWALPPHPCSAAGCHVAPPS
jgi:hypothetical protein